MICRTCGEEFISYPNKPGYINQCTDCAEDVPKLGGNMIWEHKTAPYIEIKSLQEAKRFAKLNKRNCCGPLSSIIVPKEPKTEANFSKKDTGAEDHAMYFSRLGEKRTVKL